MKRVMTLIAALTLALGVFAPHISARTAQPVAQDDEAKKAEGALYKSWFDTNGAKDYPKAIALAKEYLEKYPSGQYASYLNTWLNSLHILRVQLAEAVKVKDRAKTLGIGKQILAIKELQEQDKLDYLWFLATDLLQNELFATPPNYSHASDITNFSQQIITMVQAGKKPSVFNGKEWKPNSVQAYFNLAFAKIEENNKNTDKALEHYAKAASLDPSEPSYWYSCGVLHQQKYTAAMKKFEAYPEADQQAASTGKPEAKPEVKAALDEVNKEADAIIDCWAHYIALTEGKPDPNGARAQIKKALEDYYKYRHNESLEGLQQLIDKYKMSAPAEPTPGTTKPPVK